MEKSLTELFKSIIFYKIDKKIRDSYFKNTSKDFTIYIIKQILENNNSINWNKFKHYNADKLIQVQKINNLRLNEDGTVHQDVVREIQQLLIEFEDSIGRKVDASVSNDDSSHNYLLLKNVNGDEQTNYIISDEDTNFVIPQENFSFDDLHKNFIENFNSKFLFNPKLVQQSFDSNDATVQSVLLRVVDDKGVVDKFPVFINANCAKCGAESKVSVWLNDNDQVRCDNLINGKVCGGRFNPVNRTAFFKDLYIYSCVVCNSQLNNKDKLFDVTDHLVFKSFCKLQPGFFRAQILIVDVDKGKSFDGFILSGVKPLFPYSSLLPLIEDYKPPIYHTNFDDLSLVKFFNQIQHFFSEVLNYNLTNQGFVIMLAVLTQLLSKKFNYSNCVNCFFVGDKGLGKSFIMEVLPKLFFKSIAPKENAGDLSRARYVGGCTTTNSHKVVKGLLPTYDVVRLDEYGNCFFKTKGSWHGSEIHRLNKEYLLSPYVTVGKGQGGSFLKKGVVIAASNFLSNYMLEYKEKLREVYNGLCEQDVEVLPFDDSQPIYKDLSFYNFSPLLKKAHVITRGVFAQTRLHYILPCELPDLDRYLFVFLIEDMLPEELRVNFDNKISSYKLLELFDYLIDVDLFEEELFRNYPEQMFNKKFVKDVDKFFNDELKKINENFFLTSHQADNYLAVAKTVARICRTSEFNDEVRQTLILLFKFVNTPISKKVLDSGVLKVVKENSEALDIVKEEDFLSKEEVESQLEMFDDL